MSLPSQAGVTQLYCSKVNPLVFTGCLDGAVRLWDVRGGECVREWWGHTKDILGLAVARYVYMYNVVSISRISVFVDSLSMVQLVIFLDLASSLPLSSDDSVAVSGSDDTTAQVFSITS